MFRSFNSGQLSERLFSKSLTLLSIAIACLFAETSVAGFIRINGRVVETHLTPSRKHFLTNLEAS